MSLIIVIASTLSKGDVVDDAKGIKVSGGEDHTLVLTKNNAVWACGPNGNYHYDPQRRWYGVLGTGSTDYDLDEKTPVKVHAFANIGFLQEINDIAGGWKHSLALDANDLLWSWGGNYWGQLGDNQESGNDSTTPVRVLRGQQPQDPCNPNEFLKRIIGISAGRSGQHSLAVDANGYAYAWGYNKFGQCGNGESGSGARELTPVYVHQGAQADDPNDANNPLEYIVDICAGSDQSIAVEKDDLSDPNYNGCVYTWGTNMWGDDEYEEAVGIPDGWGLLGNASDVNLSATPIKVLAGAQHPGDPNQPYLNHIIAVSAGWNHCMALENDDPWDPNLNGRVFTWGNNGQSEKNPDLEGIFVEFLDAHLV